MMITTQKYIQEILIYRLLRFKIISLFCIVLALSSCFDNDKQLFIVESKANQNVKTLIISNPYTIYNYYSFIDLDSLKVVKTALISSWDLAFEASAAGWHVQVNAANAKEIFATGKTDFSADYSAATVPTWSFDVSSGNPDSTAVGKWVSGATGNYQYTNQVYLLGNNNGDGTYSILKKIVFKKLTDNSITFISASPNAVTADTANIAKNPTYNNVYFSFDKPKETLLIEPPKNSWDIAAGSYRSILYTDAGVATPYTVRGVTSNYPVVKTAKVRNPNFYTALAKDTTGLKFSNFRDAIGYDWKDYNSADNNPYRIVPNLYYFIKTKSDKLIKLEFTGYINANAQYGYPTLTTVNF
jgi:hypothetical protein